MATTQTQATRKRVGWFFLTAWAILIVMGIFVKRILGHADLMVFFHLPAAICLIISCHKLSHGFRKRYRESIGVRF